MIEEKEIRKCTFSPNISKKKIKSRKIAYKTDFAKEGLE